MKKRQLSDESQIRLLVVDLLRSKRPVQKMSELRVRVGQDSYHEVIDRVNNYPYKLTRLLGSHPKKLSDLDYSNLLPLDFNRELTWAKGIFLRNYEKINRFIGLSKKFSSELLKGNYSVASEVLDEVQVEMGQSIWLIKNRIALLQISEGLEAQKHYTNKIKTELRDRSLVKFVVHWTSIRNEGKTTLTKFTSQFEPIINRFDPDELFGFKEYCQYHILGVESLNHDDFVNVLRLEYSRSLVDYYEAFVALLRITLTNEDVKLKSKVNHLIQSLSFMLKDSRLDFFNSILNSRVDLSFKRSTEQFDSFLAGDFKRSYENSMATLKDEPDNPVAILQAAYSKASFVSQSSEPVELKEGGVSIAINALLVDHISGVIRKGVIGAARELRELNKLSINFNCFPWASIIRTVVLKETTMFQPTIVEEREALKVPFHHPLFFDWLKESSIEDNYVECCQGLYQNTICLQYSLTKMKKSEKWPEFELGLGSFNYLRGVISFSDGKYEEAIESGYFLANETRGYYTRKGVGLVTHSYFYLGDYEQACISVAIYYLQDRNNYPFLPLAELCGTIKSGTDEWDRISMLIDWPIIIDAYVKHVDSGIETERSFAYEDFLLSNGMSRPSELADRLEDFDREKLIYYLRYICVEANMDTSSAFEGGSSEVTSERLSVCKLLESIDPKNASVYQEEIKDIVKLQVIKSRRQEVDQSRIYIDLVRVKEWVLNNLEESFDRYMAYKSHGLEFEGLTEERKSVRNYLIDSSSPDILIPQNEVSELLKDIVEDIVTAYLSPEFGLDRFISTRIRHGILEGYLRKPIARHKLITKKESAQGPYLVNDYWLGKLGTTDVAVLNSINKLFKSFSKSYDALILEIASEWLQVKSSNKKNGLFNFQLTQDDIDNIAELITPETSFKEFIDTVINLLESTLIVNLAGIRKEIYERAKPLAKKYLNDLEENISKYSDVINFNELLAEINQARTDMQTQFDKVVQWFVPSSTGNSSPFTPEDAIKVAETIVLDSSPVFTVSIEQKEDDDFEIHGNLPIFVDIFVNAFDNVVKRSGLELPKAVCVIHVDRSTSNYYLVSFEISNELHENIDINKRQIELNRKKELFENGNYHQYVASEGNSGLFKIYKSVSDFRLPEFNLKGILDFGFEQDKFYIKISVPFRIFQLQPDEQNKPSE